MDWAHFVYHRSPVAVQNLMVAVRGWQLKRLRFGEDFVRHSAFLERSQFFSKSEIREYQERRLREVMVHCQNHVPHYQRQMRTNRITAEDVSIDNLGEHFPVLAKEDVRGSGREFLSTAYRGDHLVKINTSGTTGSPLNVAATRTAIQHNYAFFARFLAWAGVGVGQKSATFAGRVIISPHQTKPPFWRRNPTLNNTLFSSYHISDDTIPAYLEELDRSNPSFIDSYPSAIFAVAQYINLHSVPHGIRPKAIITSSETLLSHQRIEIEKAFHCPVFDQYGGAEMVAFIAQCEHGTYHMNPEYGLLEVIDHDGKSVGEGEAGQLVCTSFLNLAMPLIRYRIGDSVVMGDRTCGCGRNFPVVWAIAGRTDDFIVTPDGRYVGRLDPVFKGMQHIKESQIIQERTDLITVRIVREPGFRDETARELVEALKQRLGNMTVNIEYCDRIPRTAAGKFRSVVSRVASRIDGRQGSVGV